MNRKGKNKREKIYRGAGRRRNREEQDNNRDKKEGKALIKSFTDQITFLSLDVVSNKQPVSSLIVVFRFNEPMTPNNFLRLLHDNLADKI